MADQQFKFKYVQHADAIDHTPGSAVDAGVLVQKGSILGITHLPIAANKLGAVEIHGLYDGVKDSSVFADGDPVYWAAAGSPVGGTASSGACTSTQSGNTFLGYAVGAKLTGDTTVRFLLLQATASFRNLESAITDPGNAGAIPVTATGRVPIVTTGAQTRTLAIPGAAGQRLLIYMKTDAGDCVITSAQAINQAGNNTITMNDAGDTIELVAIELGGALRWRVVFNDGCTLSTV